MLDAIASAVANARAMPMSSSVLVNRAELLDLVEQARDVLPSQLSARRRGARRRGRGPRRSRRRTPTRCWRRRGAQAAALVDQEAVVVAAQERAAEIVAEAEQTAERPAAGRRRLLRPPAGGLRDRPGQGAEPGAGGTGEAGGAAGRRTRRETCATPGRFGWPLDLCRRVVRWFCRSWHGPRSTRGPWPCSALFTSIPVRRSCSIRTSSVDVRDRRGPCSAPWLPRRISVPT